MRASFLVSLIGGNRLGKQSALACVRTDDSRQSTSHLCVSPKHTREVVIACIDAFLPTVNKRTVIVVAQASIHTSAALFDKLEQWQQRHIEIFQLPSYSP